MASPARAVVLRTAGTNCDEETVRALETAGAPTDLVHVDALVRDPDRLGEYRLCVIPGGFSHGDDVAAGRVLGVELRESLDAGIRRFVAEGGLLVGICNGFQVLVELGLLEGPDLSPRERRIALSDNASGRFECRWVTLRAESSAVPWLEPGELLPVPVAHAEGRFVVRDERVLERLVERRQIAWRYVAEDGGPAAYPANPNGSVDDVAGVCDPSGRVVGLMPHPERNVLPWHHPRHTRPERSGRREGEGLGVFRRMVAFASSPPPPDVGSRGHG